MMLLTLLVPALTMMAANAASPTAEDIIKRSVEALDRDWKEAPRYSFVENDIEVKGGTRSVRRSAVIMIDGSPYWMLLGENDSPLSGDRVADERRKFAQQVTLRKRQSQADRRQRIAQYEKERKQNNALLREMADAFVFRLAGEEEFRGFSVYVLDAQPKPGYEPKSLETRVLTGMRGRLWIDRESFQWVKVDAELFRPVAFGLFIAKVEPGTRFSLEQKPVSPSVWLPSRFTMSLNASILWWRKTSSEDETFSEYRPAKELSDLYAGTMLPAGTVHEAESIAKKGQEP
jgi:hypothetical protein